MPLPCRRCFSSAFLLLGLSLAGCAAAESSGEPFAPQAAPVQSPPGDWSLQQRIDWWEGKLSQLGPGDREEALLRLGQLHLEAGDSEDSRDYYRQSLYGQLSRRERAHAEYGIALTYLLEGRRDAAREHLHMARADLEGPHLAECEYLCDWVDGRRPAADPLLEARLAPYLEPAAEPGMRPAMTSAPPRAAAPAALAVDLSRAAWGARAVRGNHDPMLPPTRVTVHHSAEPLPGTSASATAAEMRRIQQIHQDSNGWADIGYHYLIDRAGRIVEGRSMAYQGAHASGDNNIGNIGVCLLGNFVAQPQRGPAYSYAQAPTPAQLGSLQRLVDLLRQRYGIARSRVYYHAEFRDTECPGPQLEEWVRRYRG